MHNTVVILHCEIPGTTQSHDVRVYVSDILKAEGRITGNIVQFARSWAERQLRAANSLTDVSELRLHAGNVDE